MGAGGGVITKFDYFGGSFIYILGLYKAKIQNGNIFGPPNFKYF